MDEETGMPRKVYFLDSLMRKLEPTCDPIPRGSAAVLMGQIATTCRTSLDDVDVDLKREEIPSVIDNIAEEAQRAVDYTIIDTCIKSRMITTIEHWRERSHYLESRALSVS